MSKLTNRDTTPLARVVPHLAPETLHQLIQYRGLDACGQLVAAATPAQLTSLLDLDLWQHGPPGRGERFDIARFGEWLEVLVDTSESDAARIVSALDKSLVIAGLSRYVRVFDPGIFEPVAQSDDERIDRDNAMREGDAVMTRDASDDRLTCEVGGYVVRGRRNDAWDAIVALLLELDRARPADFHALMQGCRALSNSRPEIGGTDDLLMAPEQHLHDVAIERDQRRAQQGYATAADARAFLQMARLPKDIASGRIAANPIAAEYFRAEQAPNDAVTLTESENAAVVEVIELLVDAGIAPPPPRALLGASDEDPGATKLPVLKRLMAFVLERDESAYLSRNRELAFLANTLLSGCSVQSRPFTPREASDAAASICNLGLECWPGSAPDDFLAGHDLVAAFEVGWSTLYRDVNLFAVDQLINTLQHLRIDDAEIRFGLHSLQRRLAKHREAGSPWLARGAADVLSMLDVTSSVAVLGLLDECPILPDALTAVIDGRTTSVSASAFEFISTARQIGDIRIFIRMLPVLLSR